MIILIAIQFFTAIVNHYFNYHSIKSHIFTCFIVAVIEDKHTNKIHTI